MREILILTDSCCDLPNIESLSHTKVIPLNFHFKGDKENVYEDSKRFFRMQYYKLLECGVDVIPIVMDIDNVVEILEQASKEEKDVIIVHASEEFNPFAGDIFKAAKERVQQHDYFMSIGIVNSRLTSLGLGLLVKKCNELVENGVRFEEILDYILKYRSQYKFDFILPDEKRLLGMKVIGKRSLKLSEYFKTKNIFSMNRNGIYVKQRVKYENNLLNEMIDNALKVSDDNENIAIITSNNAQEDINHIHKRVTDEATDKCMMAELGFTNGAYLGGRVLGLAYKSRK